MPRDSGSWSRLPAQLAGRAVLVLAVATGSANTRTELLIRQALQRLRHGRTGIVIGHRLSTVRNADLILVMDHGRIVGHGTHQNLLAADGYYTRLYNARFSVRPGRAGVPEAGT